MSSYVRAEAEILAKSREAASGLRRALEGLFVLHPTGHAGYAVRAAADHVWRQVDAVESYIGELERALTRAEAPR